MADDDVAAERARLEALAWGGSAPEADAAAARLALEQLDRGRRRSAAGPTRATGPSGPGGAPSPATRRTTTTGSASTTPLAGSGAAAPDAPGLLGAGSLGAGSLGTGSHATGSRAAGPRAAGSFDSGTAEPRVAGRDTAGADPARGDHVEDRTGDDGDEPRLQAGAVSWRTRAARVLWTTRPRVWIALGVAAAVGVAFGAGTVVGTAREDQASAPSVTPTAGAVTLEELLDKPQTYADQLPGPVEASVSLRTTRLIFTNRALDGGSFRTPWSVWAAIGTDRSTICLVATANRIESTSACYPREDALHGSVSLSAQSMSGTLTLTLRGGGVQGTVTNEG
ncbi:hypothetical protein [Curtobacterium sp. MCBA15_008]|uniref:hypothetical protein n=1 Tax=Curtobacterium sp. MCBA15_008 TaxID=1898736 RepID=UPI0008DE89B1|nr:hypothetical protein [Curtobacterium sp. MCBA15_008]OII13979.1 hypothetical protein BIU96_12670 [Curtobacterium sp. MCBA15_008]